MLTSKFEMVRLIEMDDFTNNIANRLARLPSSKQSWPYANASMTENATGRRILD